MTIKTELLQISKELESHGLQLEADAVVAAASDGDKYPALHKALEWDDKKAGAQWRKVQAHQLIIRCRITVKEGEEHGLSIARPVRMFDHLRDEQGYRPKIETLGDPIRYRRLLAQIQGDLERMETRLNTLAALQVGEPIPQEHRKSINALEDWLHAKMDTETEAQAATG